MLNCGRAAALGSNQKSSDQQSNTSTTELPLPHHKEAKAKGKLAVLSNISPTGKQIIGQDMIVFVSVTVSDARHD